ncbi:MAG: O-antigen ligase family protein [Candidatus Kerfeldbacteria bacterium]|nr:O-antigen ligase family protein [Candidatus Kerfeldbacteria bacterium]
MISPITIGLVAIGFAVVGWQWPRLAVAAVVIGSPAYLLRSSVAGVPTTVLEAAVVGAAAGWLVGLATRRSLGRVVDTLRQAVGRPLLIPIGLIAAGWILATVVSIDLRASLGALKAWLLEPVLVGLMAMHEFRNERSIPTLRRALLAALLLVSAAGLVQLAFFRQSIEGGRVSSVFAPVANYLAMFTVPLLILAIGWWWQRLERQLSGFATAVGLVVLLLSFSFGGYLSLAAGLSALAVVALGRTNRRRALIGLVLAGAVLLLALLPTRYVQEKLNFVTRSSSLVRTQIWRTALAIGQERPLLGIGPNAFEPAYRRTVPRFYFPPLEWLVAKPHNLYLNLWLETGLLGLIGTVWLLVHFVRRTLQAGSTAVPYGAAAVGIMTHGLLDTPLFKNDLAVIAAVIVALGLLSSLPAKQN